MVVLTPNGRLLHAVTGYIKPKELHFELTQALASFEAVKEAALTAELEPQRKALVVRQDEVQEAWNEAFGPKPAKKGAVRGGGWQSRQAMHDREVVRENPLVHAGNITTRMLTGGPGTHFGYNSGETDGDRTPAVNEIRRRLGVQPVRETEAQKRVRKRHEAARAGQPRAAAGTAGARGATARR